MLDIPVERVYFLNRLAKKVFAFTTQNTRGVPSPRGLNFAPGAIGTALLSLLSVCMPAQATLVDNGNGTVTDTASGLMWLKDANAMGLVNWQTASSGAANLTVAGVGGWRLPAIDELKALYATLNASGTFNPAPFSNLQIDGVSDWFWSNTKSTPVCWYSYCFDTAYYMGFDTGTSATATVDYQLSALPVRSAFEYSVRVIDDSVYSTYSDPRPAGINNQGQTVGYSFRPYVWDAVNGLRKLSYSTTDGGGAYAINNAGVAVGSINTSTGARPIMWTVAATEANTTFTLLPTLGGSDAIPNNINGSGSIVGW
ncbi:MAG: DUF1566 domain-containing protein, partial [Gammaproteobacteria bacterium]|nr:DUF1566 domain-containing protein [Gammaproteobacteria bacterium]